MACACCPSECTCGSIIPGSGCVQPSNTYASAYAYLTVFWEIIDLPVAGCGPPTNTACWSTSYDDDTYWRRITAFDDGQPITCELGEDGYYYIYGRMLLEKTLSRDDVVRTAVYKYRYKLQPVNDPGGYATMTLLSETGSGPAIDPPTVYVSLIP